MADKLIDMETINSLRDVGSMIGNANYFKNIYATFEESFEKDLGEIQRQVASGNYDRAQLLAHRMKSSARTIGAKVLGEYFFVIEQEFKDADSHTAAKVQSNLEEAKEVYRETKQSMQHFL